MDLGFRERGDRLVLLVLLAVPLLVMVAPGISGTSWLLVQNFRALLWGLVLTSAAFLQGSVLLHLLVPTPDGRLRDISVALAAGLGAGALSLETFFLGLAGGYTRPMLTALVLAVLVLAFAAVRLGKVPLPRFPLPRDKDVMLPLGFTALAIYLNLAFVLVPPVYFDAMSYHLELPSRYLHEGRIYHIAENLYSGYPQIVEVLYGLGLALDGTGAAGMMSFLGFLLVMGLVWSWCRTRFGEEIAAWSVVIVAFTPPFMMLSGFFHNDWYMAFFTLATVFVLSEGANSPRSMALAGALAGLAAGTKYTGLGFAIAVPFLAGVLCRVGDRGGGAAKRWAVFAGAAVVTACPWYLKNLAFTGDPLFPLIRGMTGDIPGLAALAADSLFNGPVISSLWEWIKLPYQSVYRYWELQLPLSPGILPLVLVLTLPALRKKRAVDPFLLTWTIISLSVWYVTFHAGRFALPMAILLLVWLAASFRNAVKAAPRTGPFLTAAVVVLIFVNLGSVLGSQAYYSNVLKGAFGGVSAIDYLYYNYAPYRAIYVLNHLKPEPKVLFLGEMKGFYSEFPREVATFEVPNRLLSMIRAGNTSDEIARALLSRGFSHILYNRDEMERLASKTTQLSLDPEQREKLEAFLREKTAKIFDVNGLAIWKISHE